MIIHLPNSSLIPPTQFPVFFFYHTLFQKNPKTKKKLIFPWEELSTGDGFWARDGDLYPLLSALGLPSDLDVSGTMPAATV